MSDLILVVDDDPLARRMLKIILRDPSFDIIEAADGQETLDLVETQNPALIVLDVMMPGMSGYDVCRVLRAKPETVDLPIILYSAKTHPRDVQDGMDAGATAYMFKPTPRKEMIGAIQQLIAERSRSATTL